MKRANRPGIYDALDRQVQESEQHPSDSAIRPVLAPCGRETIAPVATRGPGSHESQTTCALHATRPAMALNAAAEDDFAVHHPGVDVGPNAAQKA